MATFHFELVNVMGDVLDCIDIEMDIDTDLQQAISHAWMHIDDSNIKDDVGSISCVCITE